MRTLLTIATSILPNPRPEQPPGTEGVMTLLNWGSWGGIITGLAVFIGGAIYLGWSAFTGREAKGVKIVFVGMVVAILVSAAGGIIRMFV